MGKITVVGVGYEAGQLTLDAVELLRSGAKILLHTSRCGCAEWLCAQGIAYESLDALYESCEDFDEHAQLAAEAVRDAAADGDVVYGVFDVRDRSVGALLSQKDTDVRVIAGPPAEGALLAHAQGAVEMLEASAWEEFRLSASRSVLIRELDTRELASEVKLRLMDHYPEESMTMVAIAGGVARIPLYNLDRLKGYDHRTCVFVPSERDLKKLERYDFGQFCEIVDTLLSPGGCPWDRAQTHQSLRPYILEEAYEVIDAINDEDPDHLYDELGDMLLQIVLHAGIAERHGDFNISDVTTAISEKMLRRHSHIFGSDHAESEGQITELWNRNKMTERGQSTYTETLQDVTRALPATLRAAKVLKRCESAGLKERGDDAALAEAAARAARNAGSAADAEAALGEALLQMAALARRRGVDPEIALNGAVDRMIGRFAALEKRLIAQGGGFGGQSEQALQEYWDLVKLSDFSPREQE